MNLKELKIERIRKEITQKEMAKKMKISEVSYNRKEQGKRSFSIEEIKSIAAILGLDCLKINEIFFDNELTNCNS